MADLDYKASVTEFPLQVLVAADQTLNMNRWNTTSFLLTNSDYLIYLGQFLTANVQTKCFAQ